MVRTRVATLQFGRLAGTAALITILWIIAALFFAWQHHAAMTAHGADDVLAERAAAMCASMMLWAVLTPVVFFVSDAFPLRKPDRLRNAAAMTLVAVCLAALRAWLDAYLPVLLEGAPYQAVNVRSSRVALFHTHLLLAFVLIGIANFLRLEREERERQAAAARSETELVAARLRQLRADLQPHFLFNTLNAVAALLHRDPPSAGKMLHRFRELLAATVATDNALEVRVAEEVEFIERYLDIQKMRFGAKLESLVQMTDRGLSNAAVPPLLLQPLVENSIVHGISRRVDGGRIRIEVGSSGEWLLLRVRDNGPGVCSNIFRSGSIGVSNAVARLESLYGKRQSLTYRREGDDLVAEIRIPLRMIGEGA